MKRALSYLSLVIMVLVPFMVQAAVGPNLFTTSVTANNPRATYSYVEVGKTPADAATDLAVLYGSATKTVKVKRIVIEQATTSAAGILNVTIVKRTAVNTGGTTAATATITKFDSAQAASTITPLLYTANPSSVGTGTSIAEGNLVFSTTNPNRLIFDFTNGNGSPITLTGVAQGLAIYLNGQTKPTGGTISFWFEFEEF